jgi:hypothetical protein
MSQVCEHCQKPFPYSKDKYRRKYCSIECRTARYCPSSTSHLASGTAGAVSELRVCADLLLKEYEVFRAMSPSCSCDLMALKEGLIQRIEVRSGQKSITGKIFTSRLRFRADVMAIVLTDEIIYEGLK